MAKPGRKPNPRRVHYAKKYGIAYRPARSLTDEKLAQLDACKNEAARRLLLGKSA